MLNHPFSQLAPEVVLAAVESLGFFSDARIFPLNSYENRVYQVGIEDQQPLIAKFYRPNRWSDQQILEEHQLLQQLAEYEIPVVAPIAVQGATLFTYQEYRFALFVRRSGHAPELDNLDHLYRLGQLLGRLHAVSSTQPFTARRRLTVEHYGYEAAQQIINSGFVPTALTKDWQQVTSSLLEKVSHCFKQTPYQAIRIHGDCHTGNLLYRDQELFIVDFDDSKMGPAIQDLWMLLAGNREEQRIQLSEVVEGYQAFYDFQPSQLKLIESLRSLHMLNYSAWLAQRWQDPAFPSSFPWFAEEQYWYQQLQQLREQLLRLEQPPLTLFN